MGLTTATHTYGAAVVVALLSLLLAALVVKRTHMQQSGIGLCFTQDNAFLLDVIIFQKN